MRVLDRTDPPPITQRALAELLRDGRIPDTLDTQTLDELAAWTGREVHRAWQRFSAQVDRGVRGGGLRASNDRLVRLEHLAESLAERAGARS